MQEKILTEESVAHQQETKLENNVENFQAQTEKVSVLNFNKNDYSNLEKKAIIFGDSPRTNFLDEAPKFPTHKIDENFFLKHAQIIRTNQNVINIVVQKKGITTLWINN